MTARNEELDSGQILIMLGGLKTASDMIIRTLSENREADARFRTDIREKIERLGSEDQLMRSDLNVIKQKVEKIEPKVESLEKKDTHEEGARKAVVSAGKIFGELLKLLVAVASGMGGGAIIDRMMHR